MFKEYIDPCCNILIDTPVLTFSTSYKFTKSTTHYSHDIPKI